MDETVRIESRLGADAMLERLKADVGQHGPLMFLALSGNKPVLGRFKGTKFRLFRRRFYGNSFAPFFYGEVVPTSAGSCITGEFRMHPLVRWFLAVWMGIVSLIGVATVVRGMGADSGGHWAQEAGFLAAMLGALFLLVTVGKWLARNEAPYIVVFLKNRAQDLPLEVEQTRARALVTPRFVPFELLVRRGQAFLWDGVIPGLVPMGAIIFSPGRHTLIGGLFVACSFIYEVVTLSRWGRGLGKKMAHLIVRAGSGAVPSVGQAMKRAGFKALVLAPYYFNQDQPFLLIIPLLLFAPTGGAVGPWRALHDRVAGTDVSLEI